MKRCVGILALQGDFEKHEAMLQSLGAKTALVKEYKTLEKCKGLIIPGGESTTLTKLIQRNHLFKPLRSFARVNPVMGTCAGSIMMASEVDDEKRVRSLGLMDITVSRNAYGRQVDSFISMESSPFLTGLPEFKTMFIRAPQITRIGPAVKVLMEHNGQPVMVQEKNFLALTFHPELTEDTRIHQYFLDQLVG